MSAKCPIPKHLIIHVTRRSDGRTITMNIAENEHHQIKFLKDHLRRSFHSQKKFRLYFNGRHIKSHHRFSYYGLTSAMTNIRLILV